MCGSLRPKCFTYHQSATNTVPISANLCLLGWVPLQSSSSTRPHRTEPVSPRAWQRSLQVCVVKNWRMPSSPLSGLPSDSALPREWKAGSVKRYLVPPDLAAPSRNPCTSTYRYLLTHHTQQEATHSELLSRHSGVREGTCVAYRLSVMWKL